MLDNTIDNHHLYWVENNVHTLTDQQLSKLVFAVWVEQQERKFKAMFDEEEGEQ